MNEAAISVLTERQVQCLRLVADSFNSKEIARVLGLSEHTVDNHLRAAIRALGVSTRRQAARTLREWEGDQRLTSPSAVIDPIPFAMPHTPPSNGLISEDPDDRADALRDVVTDDMKKWVGASRSDEPDQFGGNKNGESLKQLAKLILIGAVGILAVTILAIVASDTLGQLLLRAFYQH